MTNEALIARIEKLEERSAFQEQALEDLSKALTDHWKLLEKYKRDVVRLGDELKSLEDSIDQGGRREPPPPHY